MPNWTKRAWVAYKEFTAIKDALVSLASLIVTLALLTGARLTQDAVLSYILGLAAALGAAATVLFALAAFVHRVSGTSPIIKIVERAIPGIKLHGDGIVREQGGGDMGDTGKKAEPDPRVEHDIALRSKAGANWAALGVTCHNCGAQFGAIGVAGGGTPACPACGKPL